MARYLRVGTIRHGSPIMILGEFIMVQKMPLGIKQWAETRISGFRNME